MRIAYLEDHMAQAELVTHWLKEAGHNCIHHSSGREFMSLLRRDTFDILVLDWEVPDMNGYAVLEEVRASGNRTPVLFATQRDDESSIVGALSQGADDYMVKPTKQAELLARISALGRRAGVSEMDEETALSVGPWTVDRSRRQILLDEDAIKLTDKDYELACYLFQNVGKLMSRAHLLEKVWGIMTPIESRTVDVHISRIRRSLHIRPERGYRIKTVYQHGYRLEPIEE